MGLHLAIGSLLDVQRNTFNGASTGAIIKHYDDGALGSQRYGSLAFFAQKYMVKCWKNLQYYKEFRNCSI